MYAFVKDLLYDVLMYPYQVLNTLDRETIAFWIFHDPILPSFSLLPVQVTVTNVTNPSIHQR